MATAPRQAAAMVALHERSLYIDFEAGTILTPDDPVVQGNAEMIVSARRRAACRELLAEAVEIVPQALRGSCLEIVDEAPETCCPGSR
jgi:hypothetical protein